MARHSATTRGLNDLASLKSRLARDYGFGRVSWDDFEFINIRLNEVEGRLVEMAANDPTRLIEEARRDNSVA